MSEHNGDWIQTYTGKQFWPLDPRSEDVDIRDIAHSLSLLCRFTGHCKEFYSVAQHCTFASYICDERYADHELSLICLLHDAAEAYTNDIARPWKSSLWFKPFKGAPYTHVRTAEDRLLKLILNRFNLPVLSVDMEKIKEIDTCMLVTEARDVMGPLHPEWKYSQDKGFKPYRHPIRPSSSKLAEEEFLNRFYNLMKLTGREEVTK